jgi:DUF4097 and DUF4098 domain-containing protein YvlB
MTSRTVCLAALLVLAAAPAFAGTPIDQVRPLAADGTVSIDNLKGRVAVRTWDRDEVGIRGTLGDGVEKLVVEGSARDLRIEVRYPNSGGGWFGWGGSGRSEPSDLEVSVPARASLRIDTVSASVEVTGAGGSLLSVDTVSGDVRVRKARPGEASIDSVSGGVDLELDAATASTRVDSVSGDVRVSGGVSGTVGLDTVSGDATLQAGPLRRLTVSTVSGDGRLEAGLEAGGRLSADSVSGSLVVVLPADTSATLAVETFSGGIRSPVGSVKTEQYGPGKSLHARLGSGSGDIRLESFSGDVSIELK